MAARFCTVCGETHSGDCPPFEVRNTGINGLRLSYAAACHEIKKLKADLDAANEMVGVWSEIAREAQVKNERLKGRIVAFIDWLQSNDCSLLDVEKADIE